MGRNTSFPLHDIAPSHRSVLVKHYIAKHHITTLQHPPYSPDLLPPDFLSPKLKPHLKGRRFSNAEEDTEHATRALLQVSENSFQECFQSLYTRWQKCVIEERNNFEENVVLILLR